MQSHSRTSRHKRVPVPTVASSTGPIVIASVDLAPVLARNTVGSLLPDHVAEPEYLARGNKVRCCWCGKKYNTRAKYVNHFQRSHM